MLIVQQRGETREGGDLLFLLAATPFQVKPQQTARQRSRYTGRTIEESVLGLLARASSPAQFLGLSCGKIDGESGWGGRKFNLRELLDSNRHDSRLEQFDIEILNFSTHFTKTKAWTWRKGEAAGKIEIIDF